MGRLLETHEYQGYIIEIHHDESPESPREWCNMGTMETWDRGHISPDGNDYRDAEHFSEWLQERRRERKSKDAGVIALELHRSYYGEIGMSPWEDDESADGVAYVTYEDIRKEYNTARITPKVRKLALEVLRGEAEVYGQWATGDVYGFIVTDATDDHLDNCWGMYDGPNDSCGGYALAQGKEAVDALIAGGREAVQEAAD